MYLALNDRSVLSYTCVLLMPWSRIIRILNITALQLKAVLEVEYVTIGICQEVFFFFSQFKNNTFVVLFSQSQSGFVIVKLLAW